MVNLKTMSYWFVTCFVFLCGVQPQLSHAQQAPVPVFVTTVKQQEFVDQVEALGTVQAFQNVALTSSVTEMITGIYFTDGQRVQRGDLLVEMDSSQELALKAEELAQLAEAKKQVERLKPLTSRGAASQAALDAQQLQLQTSQARLNAIEAQIKQRKIVAPFDGIVGLRNISVGALSQPGTLITTIDDDSVMKLDFSVPELFLSSLKKGHVINAKTSAWPNDVFSGEIFSVSSRVDPMTRSISVRAFIKNPDKKLLPGLLMRVELHNNVRQALVIPEESILNQGRKLFVYAIDESKPEAIKVSRVEIMLGARKKGFAEVISGLEVGQKIVTHGTLRLGPGRAVVIKAEDDGQKTLKQLLNNPQ